MEPATFKKEEFYPKLIELIGSAQKSVHFYSVSCCFGFYSLGLKNFENVLDALQDRLNIKLASRPLDIKVLVKSDIDNPMDKFALQRMAIVQKQYCEMNNSLQRDVIFKQLWLTGEPNENVQFIIIDNKTLFISQTQDEKFNATLGLVLNVSASGLLYQSKDEHENFAKYKDMFNEKWQISSKIEAEISKISASQLRYYLERFNLHGNDRNEREVQVHLAGYLKGITGLPITSETKIGMNRIDLTVGFDKVSERYGIEIKFKPDNNAIKEIIGQMEIYTTNFNQLFLLIAQPSYNREARNELIKALDKKKIMVIEVKD